MQMVTANRLVDGIVVYLTAAGGWSERFGDGCAVDNDMRAKALMRLAEQAVAQCQVISPYLIEVRAENDTPFPSSYREQIRAFGPSVLDDAGLTTD